MELSVIDDNRMRASDDPGNERSEEPFRYCSVRASRATGPLYDGLTGCDHFVLEFPVPSQGSISIQWYGICGRFAAQRVSDRERGRLLLLYLGDFGYLAGERNETDGRGDGEKHTIHRRRPPHPHVHTTNLVAALFFEGGSW